MKPKSSFTAPDGGPKLSLLQGGSGSLSERLSQQLEAARGTISRRPPVGELVLSRGWSPDSEAVLYHGDCMNLLRTIPSQSVQLVVSSPPYNIGKSYEKRTALQDYLDWQTEVLQECERVLADGGNLAWQVGNHIDKRTNEVIPLDALFWPILSKLGLRSRNRIIWTFEHGLHASTRFSGRHETILWFQKGTDGYFDVNPIRIPQKYPNKRYFKGPRVGQLSGNPLGKNPGDVWAIPNVKHNHPEKTIHPCSFPIELAERLVLTMSQPGDWVLDPFGGVGSSLIASVLHGRRGAIAELNFEYLEVARKRLDQAIEGSLDARPLGKPIYQPTKVA
jgi:adenine-specific DNA-methyltransferase